MLADLRGMEFPCGKAVEPSNLISFTFDVFNSLISGEWSFPVAKQLSQVLFLVSLSMF